MLDSFAHIRTPLFFILYTLIFSLESIFVHKKAIKFSTDNNWMKILKHKIANNYGPLTK